MSRQAQEDITSGGDGLSYIPLCTPTLGTASGCDMQSAAHSAANPTHSPGKIPMESGWQMKGSRVRPIGNAGVLCGIEHDLIVVEVDGPTQAATVKSWELPETYTVRSGRLDGGWHAYFRWPKGLSSGDISDRIDGVQIKKSGQVVAAGSLHNSGRCYEVVKDLPIAEPGEEFVKLVLGRGSAAARGTNGSGTEKSAGDIPDTVYEGDGRNPNMTSVMGSLARRGVLDAEELVAAGEAINLRRHVPPLTDDEMRTIAKSVVRMEKRRREGEGGTESNPAWTGRSDVRVKLVPFTEVDDETVGWLSYPRIPRGKVVIVGGDPGVGKGFLMARLTANLTRGVALFPDQLGDPVDGDVAIIEYEDGKGDTLKPRLRAAGADVARVVYPELWDARGKPRTCRAQDVPALEESLRASPGVQLVFISPVGTFLGGKTDSYRDNEVRDVLEPLIGLAERCDVTVILIMHMNKKELENILYRLMGSIAFTGISRSVLILGERDGRRGAVHEKSNLGPLGETLEFRLESVDDGTLNPPARLEWVAGSELTKNDLFGRRRTGPEPVMRKAAEEFLTTVLKDAPRPSKEIMEEASTQCSLSEKVMYAAAQELRIKKTKRAGGTWWWELPTVLDLPPLGSGGGEF